MILLNVIGTLELYLWQILRVSISSHHTRTIRSRTQLLAMFPWVPVLLVLMYLSFISTWQVVQESLANLAPGPSPIIALSMQGRLSKTGQQQRIQTYLTFPDSLHTFNAYEVNQNHQVVHVRPIRSGLSIFVGLYDVWIFGSILYLLSTGHQREISPSDG